VAHIGTSDVAKLRLWVKPLPSKAAPVAADRQATAIRLGDRGYAAISRKGFMISYEIRGGTRETSLASQPPR
jgi:hypothetical protein